MKLIRWFIKINVSFIFSSRRCRSKGGKRKSPKNQFLTAEFNLKFSAVRLDSIHFQAIYPIISTIRITLVTQTVTTAIANRRRYVSSVVQITSSFQIPLNAALHVVGKTHVAKRRVRKEYGEKVTKPKGKYNEINVDGKLEDVGKTALAHTCTDW